MSERKFLRIWVLGLQFNHFCLGIGLVLILVRRLERKTEKIVLGKKRKRGVKVKKLP